MSQEPKKIKVLIKTAFRGSEHGHDVKQFDEGEVYEITPSLAETAIAEKWAVEVTDAPQEKAIDAAPSNKAIAAAPKNKSKNK